MNIPNFLNSSSRLKPSPFFLLQFMINLAKTRVYAQQCGVVFILIWTLPAAMAITPPGNALSLSGTNNFISTTTQYTNPVGITLEAWFNTTTTQGGEIIGFADSQTVCTSACDRFIWMSDDGYLHFGIWLGYIKKIDSAQSYNDGKWHHVAASLSATGMMLYIDGVLVASDTTANTTQNYSGYWNIGYGNGWGSGPTSSSYFGGKIDEVRIWNVVRTASEIQNTMYFPLVGNESGLIAYYDFDQTSGTTVPDVSGYGNTGTVQGTATWTASGAMSPFPISASDVTTTGFTANWKAVSGATGYRIDVSTDPNFGSFLVQDIAAGSGTSFNVTGLSLAAGTMYYFRMRVENSSWTSPSSASVSFLLSPGNSLLFATNQRVNCGTGAHLKPTTAFTVEAWIKPTINIQDGYGGVGIIASDSDNDASVGMTGTYFSVRNGLYGAVKTPSGKQELTGNPVPLTWQHVAMVFNGTSLTLYQDGVATASSTFSATTITPSTNPFFIAGSGLNNGWYNFQGQIDEVRVWNVARTQTEIQSKMYRTLVSNETGLVAYYNFDHTSGTTLTDLAGGDNNGSLVNTPTWTAATWNYGYPYVTTGTASAIHGTTASVGGTLVDPGVTAITASGICYATTASPTTPCTTDGTATAFTSNLTGLTPNNTPYFARAYATNSYGTNYGTLFNPDVTFNTRYIPVIAQTSPLSVTMSQNSSPTAWVAPTVSASDGENDTLTWSVNTQATNGTATVSGTGASPTTFTYSPNAGFTGSDSFIVQVADADGSATITVNVTITPTPPTYPSVVSVPASGQTIQFDTVVGQTQTLPLLLKNFGSAALFFNSINTPVAPFSYPKPMPFTFIPYGDASGSPQSLALTCTPTEMGLKTMTLQIATNDPSAPTLSYPLECLGRQPIAQSSVANNTPLNFGSAVINSTLTQTITFTETGNTDFILNSATIMGANAADFKITSPTTFPITIADNSNSSQAITVTCTPTTAIARIATLQISTNDPLNATLTYPLQCAGLYSLTLNTSGQGTMGGCGNSCVQNHPQDANVTLSAIPATGWQLGSWDGDCVNGQVKMTGNKSCTATFTQTVTNTTDPSGGTGTGTTPGDSGTGGSTTPLPPPSDETGGTASDGSPTSPTSPTSGGNPPAPDSSTPSGSTDLNNSVTAVVPTSHFAVDTAMSNYNQTSMNLTVLPNGSVSGGTLAGTVTNQGLIANVTLATGSTLTGGKLSGFNTNFGLLSDVTLSPYSQVQGGNYAGSILNNGTLNSPILSPTSTVINHGVIENPVILPGANISGGTLVGTIIVLGTFDSVSIPPTATVITQVSAIPTVIFKQVTAQTLALLPQSVISQISPEQFAAIPVASLSGLTSENMAAVSSQVVNSLDAPRIAALNPEAFKAMPNDGVAKFLTNFDTAAITPQEAEKLLPPQWKIDAQGNLTAPPGTEIAFKVLEQNNLPKGLRLPNMTDLNSSFALGGKGTNPLLNQLNRGIAPHDSTVTQQNSGVVKTEVAGSVGSGRKSEFAFMIDPEHIFILDEAALRGLQINEQGQYIIVTEDGKQIPITPMTKDPEALLAVLGMNAEVDIQKTGEVFIKHLPISRARDSEIVNSVGIFDPFIESAPEDICTPEGECDWSKADAAMQPGLRTARNLRAQSAAKVTYPDGTSQQIYPAVLFPDIFVAEAQKMAGVEKVIYRMDGMIAVTYQGIKLWLIPTFDIQVQPIPAGKKFPPSLTLQKGSLIYQVSYGDNLVTTQLAIIEAPTTR